MSYHVSLVYRFPEIGRQETAIVDHHNEGIIVVEGGSDRAIISVTYNYGHLYRLARIFPKGNGLRWLNGRTAKDVTDYLELGAIRLGTRRYKDIYAPTPGNAGHVLSVLLKWARQHPEATFEVH